MVPQVLAAAHVTFDGGTRTKAFGRCGTVMSVGGVAGPVPGSVLAEADLFLGLLLAARSLFNRRQFSGGPAAQIVLGLLSDAFFLCWTLFLQHGPGLSPFRAANGFVLFPLAEIDGARPARPPPSARRT
ncbi:hypothetical protein [Streptomyces sp. x-19]|uniref:hypothetical protein n=1 Tax=Streptomyces sp. x-19 TaxID=2789280 RepID=UPI0039803B14